VERGSIFGNFSGFRRDESEHSGSASKAASVGAKTVRGSFPLRVSTSPAATAAANSVLKDSACYAVSTMSLFGPAHAIEAKVRPAAMMVLIVLI
jgi:hypothetical protein